MRRYILNLCCVKGIQLQFLWELHFIEASTQPHVPTIGRELQFLWELHFIEATLESTSRRRRRSCSSFGNCTSLRPGDALGVGVESGLQFLWELHFIEAGLSEELSHPP